MRDTESSGRLPDVVVIGGGVIGCCTAYELTRRGASVQLLERRELAREASWASAGIISEPSPRLETRAELGLRSYRRYRDLVREVESDTGISTALSATGKLSVGREADRETLQQTAEWQREHGLTIEWLDGDQLREHEPALHPSLTCGTYCPGSFSLLLAQFARALARAAERRGAVVREQTPVLGFQIEGDRVVAVRAGSDWQPVDTLVVAAGAWSRFLGDELGMAIPTTPVRGQMLAVEDSPMRINSVIGGQGGYIVPRADGTVAVGATEDWDANFDNRVTPDGAAWLTELTHKLVPSLARGRLISTWSGLRPGSTDGEAIIGRLPHLENFWVATGHFRSGALLAPATAEWLSDSIQAGQADPRLAAFDPGRFAAAVQ